MRPWGTEHLLGGWKGVQSYQEICKDMLGLGTRPSLKIRIGSTIPFLCGFTGKPKGNPPFRGGGGGAEKGTPFWESDNLRHGKNWCSPFWGKCGVAFSGEPFGSR